MVSPERHGAMTGIMKAQIDWIPLALGAVRPTQGKTLAVMQVCGGSQSFNAVNQLRILGRGMRLITIPNLFQKPGIGSKHGSILSGNQHSRRRITRSCASKPCNVKTCFDVSIDMRLYSMERPFH